MLLHDSDVQFLAAISGDVETAQGMFASRSGYDTNYIEKLVKQVSSFSFSPSFDTFLIVVIL